MKIIVLQNNYCPATKEDPKGYYFLADSAMINTGKPFYLPEKDMPVTVQLGIAVRISRLGKNISEKFASRYFSEYAPVLHFCLPELETSLKEKGLSEIAAKSFDKSLFVGDFKPISDFSKLTLSVDRERVSEFSLGKLVCPIENVINQVSRLNTLKMGDLILPGETPEVVLKSDTLLDVSDTRGSCFKVRVK